MQRRIKLEPAPKMSADQKRFLLGELGNLLNWNGPLRKEIKGNFKPPRTPGVVRQWERHVAKLKAAHSRKAAEYKKRFDAAVSATRKAIYFGTPDEAVAAIDKLVKEFSR